MILGGVSEQRRERSGIYPHIYMYKYICPESIIPGVDDMNVLV